MLLLVLLSYDTSNRKQKKYIKENVRVRVYKYLSENCEKSDKIVIENKIATQHILSHAKK